MMMQLKLDSVNTQVHGNEICGIKLHVQLILA